CLRPVPRDHLVEAQDVRADRHQRGRGAGEAPRPLASRAHQRAGGCVMPGRYAADLARRLGRHAEAVCRHYLANGRREGNYWLVGDVRNAPGRSTYVRLRDTQKARAGKWTDAATDEHGDLLDVIRETLGLVSFKDVAAEARSFLA